MELENDLNFPLKNALEMVFAFDSTGTIFYANDMAKEKLESGGELCGSNISAVFPNVFHSSENGFEADCQFLNELLDLIAYRTNHTCFPVEAKIMEDGEPGRYICMANDMLEHEYLSKEIEKAREEAGQAMMVKSQFISNVTHELRTPVNGILGNVKELLDEELDSEVEKSLRIIEHCCDNMNKIINNILDFSALESGKFILEPKKFNFREMLDYVKNNHINRITEKGLDFFVTVSSQIPEYVIGDESRIVQILDNLLTNACKFTADGKITLEVLRTAEIDDRLELFFVVKDTGIGIGQEEKDKLFKSFSQGDGSISRKYGGVGLGLNICKQLAELMDGTIDVEGEKNKGSIFLVSIWVGLCEDKVQPQEQNYSGMPLFTMEDNAFFINSEESKEAEMKKYGTPEYNENLKRIMSKLILCVEMENWGKAERFMENIRQLTIDTPPEVKRVVLRLKMSVQKENYEKIMAGLSELDNLI